VTAARACLIAAAVVLAGATTGDLQAATPPASASASPGAPRHVSVEASPVFGVDASAGDGWIEVVTRVDNGGPTAAKGTLEVATERPGSYGGASHDGRFRARAPFNVAAHTSAIVHVPVPAGRVLGPLTVSATADDGSALAETSLTLPTASAPLLVDVDQPSRLAVVLRGWPMAPAWSSSRGYGSSASAPLSIGVPAVDATTGDPVLPERAAAYAAATVVVLPSERLAHLQGAQLAALVGWILSGGTVAVFPTRPEDLRAGLLTTLAGGAITTTSPPPIMMTLPKATRTAPSPTLGGSPSTPTPPSWAPTPEPEDDAGGATPIGYFVPVRTTPLGPAAGLGPSAALRGLLVGYAGGNLRPSAFGATAPYGLGQVHVLGFDPTASPALEDGWMHGRMLDMVADAWDRRALVAFPQGAGDDRSGSVFAVQRALDPNQNFRPALGIAALLLVLYSVIAGPLTFMRARSRSRPLDPFVWAPVASAACFGAVVLVGLAGKGWSGRARHLALVEAGAGMSRGTTHRFRGLFASQTRAMRVRGSDASSVLEMLTTDARDQREPVLRLDKDGASLEDFTSLPWQTVVVSEDGFADLGAGLSVRSKPDGSVVVTNHTGRKLKDLVVWAPQTDASWFASLDDGASLVSSGGRTLFVPSARVTLTAGTRAVHELDPSHFQVVLGATSSEDMFAAWTAITSAAGTSVDFWPDDVPVVMGEIVGGEGAHADAGLRVESDRLMFRIVGEGGGP
jgi:hypothetical protein